MIKFDDGYVSLSRDGRRQIRVSFELSSGDLAVIIGPNGCGKTTLLDVVAGVVNLHRGSLAIDAGDLPIAYVVQDSASGLLPWRSVLSNILLPAQLCCKANSEFANQARAFLETFHLVERIDDFPYKLSGGEKQLVNLIRAACTPSKIALLDEPFAALSPVAHKPAKDIVTNFVRGRTALMVTHSVDDFDLPINRCFRVAESEVVEVRLSEAKTWLQRAA